MSKMNVSGMGAIFASDPVSGISLDTKESGEVSFADVMNHMKSQTGNHMFSGKQPSDVSNNGKENKSASQDTTSTGTFERSQRSREIREQSSVSNEVPQSDLADKTDTYVADVREVLKEVLDVTEEQVEAVMAALGMTFMDLMDSNQLVNLVTELMGNQDPLALICSSEFQQVIQEIGELSENLLKDLGISQDELVRMYESVQKEIPVLPEGEKGSVLGIQTEMVESSLESIIADTAGIKVPAAATQGNVDENTTQADRIETEEVIEEHEEVSKPNLHEETKDSKEKAMDSDEEGQSDEDLLKTESAKTAKNNVFAGEDYSAQNGAMGFSEKITEAVTVNPQVVAELSGQVDVEQIIKQIVEFAKVKAADQVTTMEMQLNPQHLGKLFLELTAKEGNISARVMVQNDVVKEALEAQMSILKQDMEQAGVKVEAIEVTVESHAFEKNLEQNAKQQERQAQEQEKAAKQTRKINLNALDELSGVMTEEELLVARMMAEKGNTVDFTA